MMDTLREISNSDAFQIIFKLVLSSVLAGFIGIERSSLSKPAGFGTHAIIGLSSALIVMGSQYMSLYYDIDAARIPAQILTGIGFIGAGTIIQNGSNVKGVTTAAGILAVTCIGLAVGMGYYIAAIIATLIVFFILSVNHEVAGKFERIEFVTLVIRAEESGSKALNDVQKLLKEKHIILKSVRKEKDVVNNKKTDTLTISFQFDVRKIHKNELIGSLVSLESVKEVEELK